jgi:HAD superfamily hydrolase (TIGR01549 family)
MIKAIIFDYNGTLVNDIKLQAKAYVEIAKKHNIKMTMREVLDRKTFGRGSYGIWNYLLKGKCFFEPIKKLAEEKIKYYIRLAKKQRKKLIPKNLDKLLDKLKEKKIKTAILSHSDLRQIKKILPKKILKKIDFILAEEEIIKKIKAYKPNPKPLLFVARKLKVKPKECIYVGDMEMDLIAARNAKMNAAALINNYLSKAKILKLKGKPLYKLSDVLNLIN